jgi:hypothetical protein
MSTSGIIGQKIDTDAELASVALRSIAGADPDMSSGDLLPRAVLDMLGPYSAALYIAERVLQSPAFNLELVQTLHSKLLPLESMADNLLAAARKRGYFDNPNLAEPLRWVETCDEQVKDCMVALESALDPQLDGLMAAAMEEHQRGETVPLDAIRLVSPTVFHCPM